MDGFFAEPQGRRRPSQIGFGGFYDNEQPLNKTQLTPEQREALLESVGNRSMQAAEGLFDIIDTPASWLRDMLAGVQVGSGTDSGGLLDSWNLRPDKDALGGWGRPLAEFAVGATLDPLNLIGVSVTSKAGHALKGAGLMDDATRAMSRKLIANNALDSNYAQNALKTWEDLGRGANVANPTSLDIANDLSDLDLAARPLAGTRQSRRNMNLGEMAAAQPNPAEATRKIDNALTGMGGNETFQDLAGQTLSHDIGLRLPFSDYAFTGTNIPGGEWAAKGLDRVGQTIRWSTPMRHAHAAFNSDVGGATDEAGQIFGTILNTAKRKGGEEGRAAVTRELMEIAPLLKDPNINKSLRRILDGFPDASDTALLQRHPELQRFVNRWHGTPTTKGLAKEMLDMRAESGMASFPLKDAFGGKYFPRHVDDLSFASKIEADGIGGSAQKGRAFSGMTDDQIARRKAFHAPGSTDTINDLSNDIEVAGPNRLKGTDEEAAQYIKQRMDAEIASRGITGADYSMESARKMARTLHQLDAKALDAKVPMFGNGIADDFEKYMVGNHQGAAVNEALMDLLAKGAKNIPYNMVPEGNHVRISKAIKDLGLRTVEDFSNPANRYVLTRGRLNSTLIGARQEVLDRLQARFPGGVQELRKVSIDKDTLRRLSRIADFYERPEVQSKWLDTLDRWTAMWKASILAWPAKFVRDAYSALVVNATEIGSTTDLVQGYAGAKALVQGQLDQLDQVIEHIPAYKGMTKATRLAAFQETLSAGGAIEGLRDMDYGDFAKNSNLGAGALDRALPGMNPETTLGYQAWDLATGRTPLGSDKAAYSELGKNWDRVFDLGRDNPRDIGNPILRWGSKEGATTDKINRVAGIIGLMRQGVDGMEAIRRMKAAHIDYGSLTRVERDFFRRLMPFWAYTSRIGKWTAEKIFENPAGRYSQLTLRAPDEILNSDEGGYVPESIRSNYGIPNGKLFGVIGGNTFGETKEGVTPWLTDIDLPGTDQINMLKMGYGAGGTPSILGTLFNTGTDLVGKASHPWIKAGFESVTGIDSFTKRPVKEMDTAAGELAEDLLGIPPHSMWGQKIKAIKPILDSVPFLPRALQITNRMMDDEKVPDIRDRALQMGVNAFSGIKFQNVDDKARRIDARKKIADMMAEDPLVRTFNQTYVPEEAVPYIDPELLQLMGLDRELGRELKRERQLEMGIPVTEKRRARSTSPVSFFE